MNHSGLPTREASQFYRITPDEILVVHDELDLPPGRIKLKLAVVMVGIMDLGILLLNSAAQIFIAYASGLAIQAIKI